jgi:hypothetical protein
VACDPLNYSGVDSSEWECAKDLVRSEYGISIESDPRRGDRTRFHAELELRRECGAASDPVHKEAVCRSLRHGERAHRRRGPQMPDHCWLTHPTGVSSELLAQQFDEALTIHSLPPRSVRPTRFSP